MANDDSTPVVSKAFEEFRVSVQPVRQPVGDMYIASVPASLMTRIAYFDVRRIQKEAREVESYLGIQRPLDDKRVDELSRYVNFADASFPGSIIIAIDTDYADYDPDSSIITVRNYRVGETSPSKEMRDIARVLDGQHRIAGLEHFRGENFDVLVTIFLGADISDQAYIFATVNLEQRKVNKSLAYDLFALARSRSPERTCHNIAVAFDRDESGPFYKRIKRLGSATPGRDFETITQATFVQGLLAHISNAPKVDRDLLLRRRNLALPSPAERSKLVMRRLFVDGRDVEIGENFSSFFAAVEERWRQAWNSRGVGFMLNRTNGYRALSRYFRHAYLYFANGEEVVRKSDFLRLLEMVELRDEDFTVDRFPPGTSGESLLYQTLMAHMQTAR